MVKTSVTKGLYIVIVSLDDMQLVLEQGSRNQLEYSLLRSPAALKLLTTLYSRQ